MSKSGITKELAEKMVNKAKTLNHFSNVSVTKVTTKKKKSRSK